MPSSAAASWIRSPEDRRATSVSRSALTRSSVPAASTLWEMPELSFSSETCIATIPPSMIPISQIHARPRRSRSTIRCSGSALIRSKAPVELRRAGRGSATLGTGRAIGPETRRAWRGAAAWRRACDRRAAAVWVAI